MREISLDDSPEDLPIWTVLNYGDTRSGKTTFAATWPRTLVIADAVERGYESVKTADRSLWFEPDWKPTIWAIENLPELLDLAQPGGRIDQLIAKGDVRTIVVDAASYLVEMMLNAIIQAQSKDDNRAAYGALGKQLRNVRTTIQSKPVSVIWNCIVKHPTDDDRRGRPLIPGAQGEAWPGAVDFVFYSKVERRNELVDVEVEDNAGKTKIVKQRQVTESYYMHTRQNGAYIAGHRLGAFADSLPDPFVGTYSDLVTTLGYDVDKLREAVQKPPKFKPTAAVPAVATPVVSKPPVIVNRSTPKVATPPAATNRK